ncbi:Complement C1q-like protein 2 [Mactra antiquata]
MLSHSELKMELRMNSFIILICLLNHLVACEPQCSKFDYEEKTLAKMIRTEILVEQVMSDIKQLKQQTNDAVTSMEKLKTELRESIQSMHAENALKFEEYNNTIMKWKDRIEIKPDVVYLAKDPTTQSPSHGSAIIFGTTMYDESQSYDNSSGTFTAPVAGVYAFTAQMCLNPGSYTFIYYEIVANGKKVSNSLTYDKDTNFCNTAQSFVALDNGQTVHVSALSTSAVPLRQNHVYEWCTFSGILIR